MPLHKNIQSFNSIHSVTVRAVILFSLIVHIICPILADEPLSFVKDIRPIFRAHCFDCHGATDELEGGLDLRLVRFIAKGGDSGPAIEIDDPNASLLIDRIASGEMPPGDSRVSEQELATLRTWIVQGAKTLREEPETIESGLGITPEERDFWAYKPVESLSDQELREKVSDEITTNLLDKQFILETVEQILERKGQVPSEQASNQNLRQELIRSGLDQLIAKEASRDTLIRRAYADLIGMPPSYQEMEGWRNMQDADWYSRMLDELLASPHYGERWGRHWLDVAGYSDSEGYTNNDTIRPWAWKYRDWVIHALNRDQPFDQFITEQLAGDELMGPLEGDLTTEQIELLTATGFLRMAADGTGSGANTPEARNQVIADTLKIVGTSLLGLSIQCAQCHDHRYDPIPQQDYYAIRAIFEPAMNWQKWKAPNERRQSLYTQANREAAAMVEQEAQVIAKQKQEELDRYMADALTKELERQPEDQRAALQAAYQTPAGERNPEQVDLLKRYPSVNITPGNLYQYIPESKTKLEEFDKRINEVRSKKPEEQFVRALTESSEAPPETKLFHRGDYQQPKQTVLPHALQITCPEDNLTTFEAVNEKIPSTGRRLGFAKWITSPEHPLFSRVIANRIWLHHFGLGIVTTPADFGKLGSRPSHPKLLDWVANEFRRNNWSLKNLHRTIMQSRLYRQIRGVPVDPALVNEATDLSAAAKVLLRDYRYSFSELIRLDAEAVRDSILKVSGTLDDSIGGKPINIKEDETGSVVVDGPSGRRSLYIQSRRTKPVSILQTFDAPVMETNCEIRVNSTVATQSLLMLNGEFVLNQAAALANRVADEAKPIPAENLQSTPNVPEPKKSHWSYGFGQFDQTTNRIKNFQPLNHWTGNQWQAGQALPDADNGWVLLNRNGGHPDSPARSVIRRWRSPVSGTAKIEGTLSHGSPNGDGVRGRIVSDRHGLLGSWEIKEGGTATPVKQVMVEAGDSIDFVTESMESNTSDSFNWIVTIKINEGASSQLTAKSDRDFSGPEDSVDLIPGQIQRAWEIVYQRSPSHEELNQSMQFIGDQIRIANASSTFDSETSTVRQCVTNLCQMLLSSNEFLYVE